MKQPKTVLGLFQPHWQIYWQIQSMLHNEAETSRKLFQAVSVFCFSFISEFATGCKLIGTRCVAYSCSLALFHGIANGRQCDIWQFSCNID